MGGSESEWEDEKTDDSVSLSFISSSRDLLGSGSSKHMGKRPRASRLDPSFLKSRSRSSTLGSLAEDDEEQAIAQGSPRRTTPLSDRNMNRVPSPSEESSSSSGSMTMTMLQLPKRQDKHQSHQSPSKRVPGTPKVVGHGVGHGHGLNSSKNGRRRSNIGPVRAERPRRRSSLIPQLSPQYRGESGGSGSLGKSVGGGARRVHVEKSPAKRPKRLSLLAISQAAKANGSMRLKLKEDPNASLELSFRGGSSRPTWR